jgi:3-methyl-2-oxobutanoate hydroxymethyltransferase
VRRADRGVTAAGIPVMAHVGFTPQSEHALGGYRVQGRGDAAETSSPTPGPSRRPGRSPWCWRWSRATSPSAVTTSWRSRPWGIGAGPDTDAQVLVWQDMAGAAHRQAPRFVKRYADLAGALDGAARRFADEVRGGAFPADEHTFR